MLAKGDRLSGVLVKGVDPGLMPKVLDLPDWMKQGSLDGLRLPGAAPPTRAEREQEEVPLVEDAAHLLGQIVPVKITAVGANSLQGALV